MRKSPKQTPLRDWPETVVGGKYVRMLQDFVRDLRATPSHGNRVLFLDDVVIAYLLAFFNPTISSLRTLDDFSQTRQAQRHLSIRRLCKSTLSDFNQWADSTSLEPLIRHLHAAVLAQHPRRLLDSLPDTLGTVLAVDGSFFSLAADVAWAVSRRGKRTSARLDLHLDVATWLPEVVDISGRDTSESQHACQSIRPGAIHVYDRGIFSFELVQAQAEAGAFFVHRLREARERTPQFVAEEERPGTEKDREAGVLCDTLGRFAGSTHCPSPDVLLREVIVQSPNQPGGIIRLITNLLDVEAWAIALIYRYRWQIELFFRWLKVFANFEHLISHSREGILLSFYVAVIGVMLMYLHTGAKPSKYAFSLLAQVASGGATLDEIIPILRERERKIALERARRERLSKKTS